MASRIAQLASDFEQRSKRPMLRAVASFADALEENPAPRQLGDVRLRYEPGRLLGESLPPSPWSRQVPGLLVALGAGCALGAVLGLLLGTGARSTPVVPWALGLLAAALVGQALRLEGRLGRRRFVLHFPSERLRLEQLRWAPGATRALWVLFDEVTAVEVVQRPDGTYALVVCWGAGEAPGPAPGQARKPERAPRREVLVEHIGAHEQEALVRVWRLLHNAFGLRGAGLAGD
jgi:hypothetical protein